MNINIVAVLVAAVAQFIFGAIWYMPLFGKTWGKIHGFDTFSSEEQKKMQKEMWPLLVVQLLITILMTGVLAYVLSNDTSNISEYTLAILLWLGFILPTQIGAVLFGGTAPQWVMKKIAIMAGAALLNILLAAYILQLF